LVSRIHVFPDAAISLSGHTTAKTNATPHPDDRLMAMAVGTVTMGNIVERRSADAESASNGMSVPNPHNHDRDVVLSTKAREDLNLLNHSLG
jgi:hypothetical protein